MPRGGLHGGGFRSDRLLSPDLLRSDPGLPPRFHRGRVLPPADLPPELRAHIGGRLVRPVGEPPLDYRDHVLWRVMLPGVGYEILPPCRVVHALEVDLQVRSGETGAGWYRPGRRCFFTDLLHGSLANPPLAGVSIPVGCRVRASLPNSALTSAADRYVRSLKFSSTETTLCGASCCRAWLTRSCLPAG